MTPHLLAHERIAGARSHHRAKPQVHRFVLDRFLLLPLGAAIALLWANIAGESYFRFAHALAFPVNEILMALFLALVTQEALEATMPGGALHSWRRWGLSLIAATGGFAGAAIVYLGFVYLKHEQVLAQAWPIACAIDMGASYYLLRTIYRRGNAVSLLLVVAIASNAFALIVLIGWTPLSSGHLIGAPVMAAAIGLAVFMHHRKVRDFWPYMALCGPLSWAALYLAGVHPALALVPIVPFLPRGPRAAEPFADPPDDDPVHHAEHEWFNAVQVVLFLFGLVNAGVVLRGYDTATWAILGAAVVGRPVGMLAGVASALAVGFHLPRRVGWRDLAVVALATSSGFTLALFFASGLLPVGAVLQQVKVGALATVAGAALTIAAAWILRVGRFGRTAQAAVRRSARHD